jgi:hypothetical protein
MYYKFLVRSLDVNNTTAVLEMCKSQEVWNPACEAVIDFKRVSLHNGSATEMTELFSFEEMFCPRNLPGRYKPLPTVLPW